MRNIIIISLLLILMQDYSSYSATGVEVETGEIRDNIAPSQYYQKNQPELFPEKYIADPFFRMEWRNNGLRDWLYRRMDYLLRRFPLLTRKVIYGYTHLKTPLLAIEITDYSQTSIYHPVLLLACGIHSREFASISSGIGAVEYFLYLLENDPELQLAMKSKTLIYLPLMNPDGLDMVSHGLNWRKNVSSQNGYNSPNNAPSSYGVDLNRNFPIFFKNDNDPLNPCYGGSTPASEPEVKSIIEYLKHKSVKVFVSLHNYGERISYPWFGDAKNQIPDENLHKTLGYQLKTFFGNYELGQGAGYVVNGNMGDWIYSQQKCISFTFELDTSFSSTPERIDDLTQKCYKAIRFLFLEGF